MKKLLIFTNLVTLSILLLWGCHDCPPPPTPPPLPASGGCNVQPYQPGSYQLSGADVTEMVVNYTNNHLWAIDYGTTSTPSGAMFPSVGNPAMPSGAVDSRSVWFSISRLKGFIQQIETMAGDPRYAACCDSTLGIRIYFAEYDSALVGKFFNNTDFNYVRKHTVVMIPTHRLVGDPANHDFNPYNPSDGCGQDTTWSGPVLALAMNHGDIIPPPFPNVQCPTYMASGADFMIYSVDKSLNLTPPLRNMLLITPPPSCGD